MIVNNTRPDCLRCPSFELPYISQSRFMAICHAKHVVLHPASHEHTKGAINKANIDNVTFEPVDNCPGMEYLRSQGLIQWASSTIDFLNK